MTFRQLIEGLKLSALQEPNITWVGYGDIYKLNSNPEIQYPVFYITPITSNLSQDAITYSNYLYFVERFDETENNQIIEQSNGILAIHNIVNRFNEWYPDAEVQYPLTFTPFYERFKDQTTGVFCRLDVITDNILGTCQYGE